MQRWSLLLVGLLGILSACFEPALPRGDHLGPAGGAIFGGRLAPGEERVVMIDSLENHSDETLTIESIEPYGVRNIGQVAEVVSVEVAPRSETERVVVLGSFDVYPPAVVRSGDRCVVQPTEPFFEYMLEPDGERPPVAVRFRAIAPGRARTDGLGSFTKSAGRGLSTIRELGCA